MAALAVSGVPGKKQVAGASEFLNFPLGTRQPSQLHYSHTSVRGATVGGGGRFRWVSLRADWQAAVGCRPPRRFGLLLNSGVANPLQDAILPYLRHGLIMALGETTQYGGRREGVRRAPGGQLDGMQMIELIPGTSVSFPVLAVDRDGCAVLYRDEQYLTTAVGKAGSTGQPLVGYVGMKIVDRRGHLFEVTSATRGADLGPLYPGLNLGRLLFRRRRIEAKLSLSFGISRWSRPSRS